MLKLLSGPDAPSQASLPSLPHLSPSNVTKFLSGIEAQEVKSKYCNQGSWGENATHFTVSCTQLIKGSLVAPRAQLMGRGGGELRWGGSGGGRETWAQGCFTLGSVINSKTIATICQVPTMCHADRVIWVHF